MLDLVVSSAITIPASDMEWVAVRSSGPGGQNVNKVSSKIELWFHLRTTTALSESVKSRLLNLAKNRIDARGDLHITSQAFRDRTRNLEDALDKLRELILAALVVPKARRKTKPSLGAKLRRLDEKQRHGEKKRQRRRDDDS